MNLTEKELNRVTEIWLNEAKHAHKEFICKDFWESRIFSFIMDIVREITKDEYELYVYEKDEKIQGFITAKRLSDTKVYISNLYVDYQHQRNGIGKVLLDTLTGKYKELTLSIYKQNSKAVDIYIKKWDFKKIRERTEDITGLKKLDMKWAKT